MDYMLIFCYKAFEKNVNLSQVYSVFKKETQVSARSGGRTRGEWRGKGTEGGRACDEWREDWDSVPDAVAAILLFLSCAGDRLGSSCTRLGLKLHLLPSYPSLPSSRHSSPLVMSRPSDQ